MTISRYTFAIGALVLIAFALLASRVFFSSPSRGMDEALILVYADQILNGKIPYRDFFTIYGPANFYIMAGCFKIFSHSVFVERCVASIYHLIIVLSVYYLSRRQGIIVAFFSALLCAILLLSTKLTAFSYVGAMAAILMSLVFLERITLAKTNARQKLFTILSGFTFGLALLFRFDFAFAGLLTVLIPLILMDSRLRCWYLCGALLGVTPYLILLYACTPTKLIDLIIYDAILPRLDRGPFTLYVSPWLFYTAVVAALLNLFSSAIYNIRPKGSFDSILASIGLLSLGVLSQAWQRPAWSGVMNAQCIGISFLPLCLSAALDKWFPQQSLVRHRLLAVGVAFCLFFIQFDLVRFTGGAIKASLFKHSHQFQVRHSGRTITAWSQDEQQNVERLLADIDKVSTPGQRLYVGPTNLATIDEAAIPTFIYFLLPTLRSDGYYLEITDFYSWNKFLIQRLSNQLNIDIPQTDILVLMQNPMRDDSATTGDLMLTSICPDIEKSFRLYKTYGPYQLYIKKELLHSAS